MVADEQKGSALDEQTFISGSQDVWQRLGGAVEAARARGVVNLESSTLRQLHEDYRRTAADLAYAQTHYPGTRTEAYLNSLVGQAHAELYGAAPRKLSSFWAFITRGYPRLVRAHTRDLVLAATLLLGATALGYLLAYVNYPLARIFIPEGLRDGVGDSMQQSSQMGDMAAAVAPLLSAGITANNIQVSLLAFAGGMTFGAVTVYALVQNGLLLGALAGVFGKAGESLYFWSLIVPHGALEIPAIVLAGASGLVLARALISPGDLPRSAALKAASPEAARIVLGVIPLLVIAGLIEGFLTPSSIDPLLKIAFGVLMTVLLTAYLVFGGRGDDPSEPREGDAVPRAT